MNNMMYIIQYLFILKTRLYYSFLFGAKKVCSFSIIVKDLIEFTSPYKNIKSNLFSVIQIFKIGLDNWQKNTRAFQQVFNKIANTLCLLMLTSVNT